MNKVLVTGSTGFQGFSIVKTLLEYDYSIRGLILGDEDSTVLQSQGIEIAIGNFEDKESLQTAFHGIDKVVLSFPLIFDEKKLLKFAENIVYAWKNSNVKHFVFNTNLPVYHEKVGLSAFDSKLAIENYFDKENLPYISLRPTLYMDNLSAPFLLPVIQSNGIIPYPVPADKKIAWMSHKDLSNFVLEALKRPQLIGQKFYIGGVQLVSGNEIAEIVSRISGKKINFVHTNPDEFESQLTNGFGTQTAKEIANIYRFVEENVEHLQAKKLRESTLIKLPATLQTFDSWASSIEWT
ncbi:uncharacterized protein YbjT (DUF2867 family) [Nonlabens dokdonensis]|jgi:uncharacterized protein YbjT (DUF2867 family)|uniref:NmrA family protein n=2 Tax=Nonlabens dokdonensis TaxID=328515 RepID=L7W7E9_NONDD|nr:NmrA family NAD(P)-binding protein [Nonlabens dokdonensis]AGC76074.1 NmrA family protein [Nonlabens dokdonensis DSW-6]PZX43746.1 uncharacterized protein YbjT (DUF2867 family) [Nonlabens dokdonensis]